MIFQEIFPQNTVSLEWARSGICRIAQVVELVKVSTFPQTFFPRGAPDARGIIFKQIFGVQISSFYHFWSTFYVTRPSATTRRLHPRWLEILTPHILGETLGLLIFLKDISLKVKFLMIK